MAKRQTNSKTQRSSAVDETELLLAIVAQTAFDGWTQAAITQGAQSCGATEAACERAFPRGISDVIAAFSAWATTQMQAQIAQEKLYSRMRVRDKVAYAVRARLESLAPYREAMRTLCLWYAVPTHAPEAARNLARLCDAVWVAAGDNSTDFNFYTKRALLAYVVKTTTLFWLQDDSPAQSASWDFLDRRIAEVLRLGQAAGQLQSLPEKLGKLSKLADIAGRFRRAA